MNVRILGAHNVETKTTRCTSLLIDDVLALDAGALTSTLSIAGQLKLRAVLLTHQHYDHIKDIPALGMNFLLNDQSLSIYTTRAVYNVILNHLLNDVLYPNFTGLPGKQALKFTIVEPGKEATSDCYSILPVAVKHGASSIGYQVTAPAGDKVFFTSDTGPGLEECWAQISPDLLIIEVTSCNDMAEKAVERGHLTASLLQKELEKFRALKGYLPRVATVHMNPFDEETIISELAEVSAALGIEIMPGKEGMRISLKNGR
jgi:ribonuclease BN (tRNA processing enzyme)